MAMVATVLIVAVTTIRISSSRVRPCLFTTKHKNQDQGHFSHFGIPIIPKNYAPQQIT